MGRELMSVRERLERLQKDNYRSLPERPTADKTVEEEVEDFKKQELISPVSGQLTAKKEELNTVINEADGEPRGVGRFKEEETETISRIEQKLIEIESIKKGMMANGNYMKRLYEIKPAEKRLLPILYDAKIRGMRLPEALKARISAAAPKAVLLD